MKVLFPTDFSEMASRAWKLATTFAIAHKAELVLLHVIEPPAKALQVVSEFDKELAYRQGRKLADNFLAKHPVTGLRTSRVIKIGPVAKMIAEAGDELEPVAIVMGTHGKSGFRENIIGSNASRVLKYATVPVLATREEPKEEFLSHFLLPIDLTHPVKEKIRFGISIAKQFHTNLRLLYVVNTEAQKKAAEPKMQALVNEIKGVMTSSVSGEVLQSEIVPSQAIAKYAEDQGMGMICIMTYREHGLKSMILGSTAKHLLEHATKPVIAIRPKTIYQARATGSMLS